jgi:uncharacterized protein
VANSLAAIRGGARQLELTINGIGERAGNASLEELAVALRVRQATLGVTTNLRLDKLYATSQLLSEITGVAVAPNKAVVGSNAFAHEAGIHQDGVLKNPLTYEIISPEEVGVPKRQLVFHGLRCVQKVKKEDKPEHDSPCIITTAENNETLAAFRAGANVLAGTQWLWAQGDYLEAVDALFVDEAGQMALANVLSVAQAAKNLVLLGDPQQLHQPLKGSHPEGADLSALEYFLGDAKTMPAEKGLFLEKTWRLHPKLCAFTSEVFYEDRLLSVDGLDQQRIEGHPWLGGNGLWFIAVEHEGNQNSSPEEVGVVVKLVDSLTRQKVHWTNGKERKELSLADVLVVAPYNAQVSDLLERMPGARVGTVDKFQGQEAPVVIYSLTTSAPEDAPRGMEFLYSLNRLNVATSRAQAVVVVVASLPQRATGGQAGCRDRGSRKNRLQHVL